MAEPLALPGIPTAPIDADTLFKWFACRNPALNTAMVYIDRAGHPAETDTPLADRLSSLGLLDCLPAEILSLVLGMLDTQSVPRFACASFKGAMLVRSHLQYQELRQHASQALAALAMTGTACLHSVRRLHAALRSDRCALCPDFGSFLFLPTGKRCCGPCLQFSPHCQMIDVDVLHAREGFLLSLSQLQQLRVLRVPPRTFWGPLKASQGKLLIVRKQAARELALTMWPR